MREPNITTMNSSDLTTARVIGYFSLPPASLAEANPTAYTLAMAAAPAGAGSCALCGMSIMHHVVVQLADGGRANIGTDCAERVGRELRQCVRERITADQLAAREAREAAAREASDAARAAQLAARAARRSARIELFRGTLECLAECHRYAKSRDSQDGFWRSLGDQLADGPLSPRQSKYVLSAVFGRRNKANAAEFDQLADRLEAEAV